MSLRTPFTIAATVAALALAAPCAFTQEPPPAAPDDASPSKQCLALGAYAATLDDIPREVVTLARGHECSNDDHPAFANLTLDVPSARAACERMVEVIDDAELQDVDECLGEIAEFESECKDYDSFVTCLVDVDDKKDVLKCLEHCMD